jgi:hypothetical protein
MLATSPATTTLCAANTWACEGTWPLVEAGLIERAKRWDRDQPKSWAAAMAVFEKFWDPSRPIRLEKSPPNLVKVKPILDYFKETPNQAAFISMSMSACFKTMGEGDRKHHAELAEALDVLKTENARHLHMHYEDWITDPYRMAQLILGAFPELEELDPALSGVTFGSSGNGDRAKSVVDYVTEHGAFENEVAQVSQDVHRVDERLGYVY